MTPLPVLTEERVRELRALFDNRGSRMDADLVTIADHWLRTQWVPVTERLPTELHVLVCDAKTQWAGDYWRLHESAPFPPDITHWRPMPPPPQEPA